MQKCSFLTPKDQQLRLSGEKNKTKVIKATTIEQSLSKLAGYFPAVFLLSMEGEVILVIHGT